MRSGGSHLHGAKFGYIEVVRKEVRMPGMDSEKLSNRSKQPGHDQTYKRSEVLFFDAAKKCLDE